MTKADIIMLLDGLPDSTKVILYDGDDSIFRLSSYGQPTENELWLKVSFDTTVEDL